MKPHAVLLSGLSHSEASNLNLILLLGKRQTAGVPPSNLDPLSQVDNIFSYKAVNGVHSVSICQILLSVCNNCLLKNKNDFQK